MHRGKVCRSTSQLGHSLPSHPARMPTDVSFAAKATELLRRRDMSRWVISDKLHCSNVPSGIEAHFPCRC